MHGLNKAVSVVCALAALAVFLAYRQMYGAPPAPSGRYAVVKKTIEVAGRTAPIPIHLWYPVDASGQLPQSADGGLPLVLFQAGWGGKADANTLRLTDLASHGYIIAGFDDIMHDTPGAASDTDPETLAAIKTEWDTSSDAASQRTLEAGNRRVRMMSVRASELLTRLQHFARNDERWRQVDFSRVGFLGYSLGGAVAVETARTDSRIKVVANLDGSLFGDAAEKGVTTPYLFVSSEPPPADNIQSSDPWTRLTAEWWQRDIAMHRAFRARSDFLWLKAERTNHSDFTDELFTPSWRNRLKRGWGWRVALFRSTDLAIMRFMDAHLKGEAAPQKIDGNGALPPFER